MNKRQMRIMKTMVRKHMSYDLRVKWRCSSAVRECTGSGGVNEPSACIIYNEVFFVIGIKNVGPINVLVGFQMQFSFLHSACTLMRVSEVQSEPSCDAQVIAMDDARQHRWMKKVPAAKMKNRIRPLHAWRAKMQGNSAWKSRLSVSG